MPRTVTNFLPTHQDCSTATGDQPLQPLSPNRERAPFLFLLFSVVQCTECGVVCLHCLPSFLLASFLRSVRAFFPSLPCSFFPFGVAFSGGADKAAVGTRKAGRVEGKVVWTGVRDVVQEGGRMGWRVGGGGGLGGA